MAFVGQTPIHLRQRVHFAESIKARLFVSVIASNAHSLTQSPQPIQATLHDFRIASPLSLLTQLTYILFDPGPFLLNSMIAFGHAFTQALQEVHFCSSISGNLVTGLM